ncbi:MAG: hypothetical protein LC731_00490, partial [Acidobacteria bacterium]|nr:hypothetical protein [Acidobacteriota bacterium]
MRSRLHKRLAIILFALILLYGFSFVFSQAQPQTKLFDDERVVNWSKDFLAGKREQVIAAVERDLKSPAPHPFAPHVWVNTQFYLGRLKQSWQDLRDPDLRKALGVLPDVYLLNTDGQYKELLKRYPSSSASQIRDPWALHYLFFAANTECRYEDALAYVTQ